MGVSGGIFFVRRADPPGHALHRHRRSCCRWRRCDRVAFHQPDESDASTIAAGAPVDVDLKAIPEGGILTVKWRGKPIFVRHRTAKEIKEAADVNVASLPDPQTDAKRVKKPEWLVVIGMCTHLGCVPIGRLEAAAITTAGSAPAMARNTTPRAASVRALRRPTCRCRPTLRLQRHKIQIG